jgi:hypothetical protein
MMKKPSANGRFGASSRQRSRTMTAENKTDYLENKEKS